ncbi:MAG: glycosyltransferase, partial [Dokdonella sp.]|uniref:glycosyltransferase n=1 Tax=Dokdonella sp. TaxID=2291710 RepID=UPI0032667279
LSTLRARLPASATVSLLGRCAVDAAWDDAERLPEVAEGEHPSIILADVARRYPGEHVILVRADAVLPTLACERLLRALLLPDVIGAVALDRARIASARQSDVDWLDAIAFAMGDRDVCDDDAFFGPHPPAMSAWHAERIGRIAGQPLRERDAIDAAGLRVVLLDHLVVDSLSLTQRPPTPQDPRDPTPPTTLDRLRERIGAALRAGFTPSRPGLDARPVVLHVLHGWGGGAERWVRDVAAADQSVHHLVLIARGSFARRRHGEWLELHEGGLTGPPLRRWPLPRAIADTALGDPVYRDLLAQVIGDICVDAVVVSSLIGHSLDVFRTGLPTFCIVHDHYPLWPVLHRDFGDPALSFDDAQREADLDATGDDREFANRDWRHWQRLRDATVDALRLANATLIAPSRSALLNHLRLAPELGTLPQHVVAHGLAPWRDAQASVPLPAHARPRLLVPGRIRRGKGAELLLAALPRLREHVDLFLVGAGADAHALFGERGVHILLDYQRDDLPKLLADIRPDAALLLPTVAETFSYTLSELRSLGVPVIATRVGALAERIDDGVDGFLVDAQADDVVARVVELLADPIAFEQVRRTLASHPVSTLAEMADAYTSVMRLGTRKPLRYPVGSTGAMDLDVAVAANGLARSREHERLLAADLRAVRAESERRGDWGHTLDRNLAALYDKYTTLHDDLSERTRWALALDTELQDVKPRYEQTIASTSWRITAPLRRANAIARRVRASLAFRSARLRATLGRVRGSLVQRGVAGTLSRIAQELRGSERVRSRLTYPEPREDVAPFEVPSSDTPRVSIVIPVYNKIAYTTACLRSIVTHAGTTSFEIIVVDDGSSDATPQRLDSITGIRSVRNAQNLGFIGSCNAGAAIARGDFLLFLNNDTVVTTGWLEPLVDCIDHAPDAGLVGAKLVYPDGRLQEAGGIVFNDGSGWNYGRFGEPDDARYDFRREVDYCSGAAILLRRDLFERLGQFDTRYTPAYYEDTDLAFAVREAGLKVYVEPAATVVHFEGITSGTDTASGTKRFQVINQAKFAEKWKDALARQPAPGTPIGIAATHRWKKRVLIIDATIPQPDHDAGSVRMVNLMRVLGELGYQVSFMPDNRLWTARYTPALQSLGVEVLYAPYAADPVALLRERGREFDLVILSRHYVAASYVGLARLYAPQATLAFDTVDLHYLRERRAAEVAGVADPERASAATRAQELKIIRECDLTLVVSEAEQALLATDAPGARVEILSTVNEVHGCRIPFAERRDLVFVGGFQHPPNADAVAWFVREVFPLLRADLPDVRFHVIGSKVPDAIRELGDDHVLVHGFVEDITPYMDGCRVSVAPLRYGAGVKGKINTAMSYGLPVVATTLGVEGMHVRAGEDVLVADSPAAFAAEVARLYRDESLWKRLSTNGLANVEQHFSFAAARTALQHIVSDGMRPA